MTFAKIAITAVLAFILLLVFNYKEYTKFETIFNTALAIECAEAGLSPHVIKTGRYNSVVGYCVSNDGLMYKAKTIWGTQ